MPRQLEWVKQPVSSAPGTGDTIALGTAIAGYIGFNVTGVADNTPVRYTATDGENRERGWAIYISSTTSLKRIFVDATLSAGVYTEGRLSSRLNLSADTIITCEAIPDHFQPQLELTQPVFWSPRDNSTTADSFGILPVTVGTVGARAVDLTSASVRHVRRLGIDTTAVAGNVASWRTVDNPAMLNDISVQKGGFKKTFIVGANIVSYLAVTRGFVGLVNSTAAPTNVNPPTMTNCIGFGLVDGSDFWHIVYGGSSAQTPINLGAVFNGKDNTAGFAFTFESKINVFYPTILLTIEALSNGVPTSKESRLLTDPGASGVVLPSGLDLYDQVWRTNNSSASVVPMDVGFYSSQYLY